MSNSTETISYKRIFKIALPIIIGGLAQNVIMATDVIFMAGVSQVSLDAVGLAGLLYSTFFVFGFGFSIGVQVLIARRDGEKDYLSIGRIFDSSLIIMFIFSLLMYLIMMFYGPVLLKSLVSSEAVYHDTVLYLQNRAWGIFFSVGILAFRSFYLGISNTSIISYSTGFMAVLNVVLNYCLIFGHWGFPAWGIAGAAVASSISEVAAYLFTVVYTFSKDFKKKYGIFKSYIIEISDLRIISRISSPIMFQYFFSHGCWFLFFIIIEQSGELALAISVIIRVIYMFIMTPFWGLGAATNTLVSFSLGENKKDQIASLLKRIIVLSLLLTIPFIFLNVFFGFEILNLIAENAEVALAAVPTLHVITVALVFFSVANIFFSAVTGSGNTRVALVMEVGTLSIYLLLSYWLGIIQQYSVEMVWLTEVSYFLLLGFVSAMYLKYSNWKETKI